MHGAAGGFQFLADAEGAFLPIALQQSGGLVFQHLENFKRPQLGLEAAHYLHGLVGIQRHLVNDHACARLELGRLRLGHQEWR